MVTNKDVDNNFLKDPNKILIMDLIRVHKAISLNGLSQKSGISLGAVGEVVSFLIEKEFIQERKIDDFTEEVVTPLLELKPKSYYTIGVDLDWKTISVLILDMTGDVVCERLMSMPMPSIFQFVVAKVEKAITELMSKYSITNDRLIGIGISIPGVVDSRTQEVVLAPNLGWRDINISADFIRLFNTPVFVENDSMSLAFCENWMGACQNVDNFVCINIRTGIGSGIFTNGNPYRGGSGSAGEVGHIVVDETGPRCGCGNHGCLGVMAAIGCVVEKVKKVLSQGASSSLNEFTDTSSIGINHIITAAKNGDEVAKSILIESARYIGIAISHIVNTLNPEKIVIGKEFVKYADVVMENIKNVVYVKALKFSSSNLELVASKLGENATTVGAAIIPLRAFFGK